jgi:hypothetical protein
MVSLALGVFVGLLTIAVVGVRAQNDNPAGNTQKASPSPAASPQNTSAPTGSNTAAANTTQPVPTPTPPKVVDVKGHLELDTVIQVKIDHFSEWALTHDATKLVPFLNGRAVRGNYPEELHPDENRLHFHLEMTPDNKEVWTDLLGEPPADLHRPVTFTIGLETQSPFASVYDQTNTLPLTIVSKVYGVVSLLVIVFTLTLFLWLARKTNLIREPGLSAGPGKLRPYNLGRTQMAFWFFLIYVSYLVIWLITDALDTITPSLLGLMGISAGTALSESMIDSSKDDAKAGQLQNLNAERETLAQTIATLQSQIDNLNAMTAPTPADLSNRDTLNKQQQENRTALAQIDIQIQALTVPVTAAVSGGFLKDILSDSSGYSFHRFQIFAWTIVLGIIFVSSVYNNLNMPEFSATLLGLMGLSSGTYIGFKFPEKK